MSDCAKHPDLFTDSDKKETLARLRRRARHLDRKWVIGRGEPIKGFTLLGLIPVFGSMTGSALAIGYLREIRRTVALPDNLTFDMIKNILLYTAVTMVPVIGWIGKRVFGVNKRNYSILEEYLMSAQPCQEKPEERGILSATDSVSGTVSHSSSSASSLLTDDQDGQDSHQGSDQDSHHGSDHGSDRPLLKPNE